MHVAEEGDVPPVPVRTRKVKKCPHSRQTARCRDCGGGSICNYNREKKSLRHVQLLHMLRVQLRVQRPQVLFQSGFEATHVVEVPRSEEDSKRRVGLETERPGSGAQ